jgi:hypothetical protein
MNQVAGQTYDFTKQKWVGFVGTLPIGENWPHFVPDNRLFKTKMVRHPIYALFNFCLFILRSARKVGT